jgi:perosamine synthetase
LPTVFENYPEIGYNFRLTDVQAAIGLAQLDRLDEILARRRTVAERFQRALSNHPVFIPPHVPPRMSPNWQSYQIALSPGSSLTRNAVMERLYYLGVPTRRGVMASHLEPPYRSMNVTLPITEAIAAQTLLLPIHPALDNSQQERVLAALDAAASYC